MRLLIVSLFCVLISSCGTSNQGDLSLVEAIISGNESLVSELLSLGVDPNESSEDGLVPIMVATGSTNVISDAYSTDKSGRVVENLEILRLLLKSGANANYKSDLGMTPLLNAVYHGRQKSVLLLLEYSADPDVMSEAGLTPLMYASKHCMTQVARVLVSGGANVKKRSPSGENAYDIAKRMSCDELDVYGVSEQSEEPMELEPLKQ